MKRSQNESRYYAPIVKHCMNFYLRYPTIQTFKTEVDRQNWQAVDRVITKYTRQEREMLKQIYASGNMSDNVVAVSIKEKLAENDVWCFLRRFEKLVAIERGVYYESEYGSN